MRLARANRDRPAVVVAAAMEAAAVDMAAVVAKVVVASEEATRNSPSTWLLCHHGKA
jgi:hypothetical protein